MIELRRLEEPDCALISRSFAQQGWQKPVEQYADYLREQEAGGREVLVAHLEGEFAGYLTIVWESPYALFREAGIPEIKDLNVLIRFRRRGVATRLLEAAESLIGERSPCAGIGVGLIADYGPAQLLYALRGYLPDARGAMHGDRRLQYGDRLEADDDLVLYMTKELTGGGCNGEADAKGA